MYLPNNRCCLTVYHISFLDLDLHTTSPHPLIRSPQVTSEVNESDAHSISADVM